MISVIIPTYNGLALLRKNLDKWLKLKKSKCVAEIIIIDNGSTDSTAFFIKQYHQNINYYRFTKNKGFTEACNYGVKKAKGERILFLNNDCWLELLDLTKLDQFLDKHTSCVATQPIVELENHSQEIGYQVDLTLAKAYPLNVSINNLKKFKLDNGLFKESRYFYGLSATCLMIKKEIFLSVGGFDKNFHSYLEDIDLFFRLAIAGYSYTPCLGAKCIHEHMATSSRMGAYKALRDLVNWYRIIFKHYPFAYLMKHGLTIFIERLRNLSGLFKILFKNFSFSQN